MALRIILLVYLLQEAVALVNVNPGMKSFSYAIKNGFLFPYEEKTLYEHNTGQPGVITEQWFTGQQAMNQDTRIRIYIDNEPEASLDFQLLLAHGVGFREANEAPNTPWGTRRIGHDADGGIFNTFRIPFGKSFRVTATRAVHSQFWYIIRGVENYPVVLGDLVLPSNARLKLYKNINVFMKPFEFLPLAYIPSSAGAVFMVTLAVNSSNLVFLEGCLRAFIDGSNKTTWLSSGTEDFFLSAYYFNRGIFHQDNSGLTYKDKGSVSAFKFFENDPLLFSKSFELWWRCSDVDITKDKHGCPNTWPDPSPYASPDRNHHGFYSNEEFPSKEEILSKRKFYSKEEISKKGKSYVYSNLPSANVTTYTWVYEW